MTARALLAVALLALPAPAGAVDPVDPVIAAAGDIACSPSDPSFNGGAGTATACRMLATSDLLLAIGEELTTVLALGDTQYSRGRLGAFLESFDPTWGRLGDRLRAVVGNHEYGTDAAADYYTYFGERAGDPTRGYYSFEQGAWHVVVLNSVCAEVGGCGPGSPQHDWLLADLAAHPVDCVLAAWHHPRFSSGAHGDNSASAPFWQALYDAGADVVLNGHDHLYERFAPQDPAAQADAVRGLRAFTVGTGGKVLVPRASVHANSEIIGDEQFGVLRLTLLATGYDWEFVPLAGGAFQDSGHGRCRRRAEDFYTVTPCRVLDTRSGAPLAANQTTTIPIAGVCGVPADATAVAANLTTVAPGDAGWLEAWPAGGRRPGNGNLSFGAGRTIAASSVLPLGVDGAIALEPVMPSGTVHLILDVNGYFY